MSDFIEKFVQKDESWIIHEDVNDKRKRKLYEALFSISNGYFGMWGINEDVPLNTLPGAFIAGAFDKSECMCAENGQFSKHNFTLFYNRR